MNDEQKPDVMQRARLANGGRGAVDEPPGKFETAAQITEAVPNDRRQHHCPEEGCPAAYTSKVNLHAHQFTSGHGADKHLLGMVPTRELLEELRLRGDLAMVAMPTTERGADGAALYTLARVIISSSCLATLEAVRGS